MEKAVKVAVAKVEKVAKAAKAVKVAVAKVEKVVKAAKAERARRKERSDDAVLFLAGERKMAVDDGRITLWRVPG
ncbi:hypothetical protein [Halomicrococcus sp. NG-SE-24]|uniref:hypothetical protein n=1 Tax=Halomicrococcus sp. NG-SE-24 TaxID=3436928 RepID=UPI003D994E04